MRLRAPIWSFPRRWRDAHAAEIQDLFDAAGGTMADWLDILAAGLMVRLEDAMRPLLITAAAAIAAISLVMLGYAAAAVSEGFLGLHKHWWSTAPAATFALCMLALIMLAKRRAHLTRV